MEIGRFFMKEELTDNVFYYKDIYLIDKEAEKSTPFEKYPIRLVITDDELVVVHNRIHVRVVSKSELAESEDKDKHKLSITPRQFRAYKIPYTANKIKIADKMILEMYNHDKYYEDRHFKLHIDSKAKPEEFEIDEDFFKNEIYDEGYNYFYNRKANDQVHTFSNIKTFGIKKMYKRKQLDFSIDNNELRLIIPFKRIFLEFLYDYHFMNVFQDALPKKKADDLDWFFNKSIVVKGISLKLRLVYWKNIINKINKANNYTKGYWAQEYEKLLKSWRKLIISEEFENIENRFYGKHQWFEDSEKEIWRVHKEFLPLLKKLKNNGKK